MVDVAVPDPLDPFEVVDVVHPLEVHGDALAAVGDLGRNRLEVDPAGLLEIGELGDFHAVEPHLPAEPPGPQCGRLPVVLDETDVVLRGVDPEALQRIEIEVLNVHGGRLHDHLELVIMLKPVGVLAVAPVGGTARRLDIGDIPGLRTEHPKEGGRVEGSGALLDVVGLLNDTTLFGPVILKG